MATTQIEEYMLAWHPQQGCELRIRLKGASQWNGQKIPIAEVPAIAAILNESPVFVTNGWIHTGGEPPGT